MTSSEDRDFIKSNKIHFDSERYNEKLMHSYEDERLPQKLQQLLAKHGFKKATPIQAISIPWILSGNDYIGISRTGSGKTLSFLVPALVGIVGDYSSSLDNDNYGPRVMVVSPTRELALQTHDVVEKFNDQWSVCVYGGSSRTGQSHALRSKKPPIIIGTPGRINDFVEFGTFHLKNVNYLVFDEADRMFDMGFHPQIMRIVDACSEKRQNLLFSATWTRKVQELANPLLDRNRIVTSVGEFKLSACKDIRQHLFLCREYDKKKLLEKIMREFEGYKILVFVNTKNRTQQLASYCEDRNLCSGEYIHGDCSQDRRESIIKRFNLGRTKVIFATDVASRGLDINDISVVVNYDFPKDVETYVHRIGRSGRNGKKGLAFTFVTDYTLQNSYIHNKLVRVVKESGNTVPNNILNY